ncbi:MAG TPA: DUF4153 domain-containing protein [Rhizomicrobium sp.]
MTASEMGETANAGRGLLRLGIGLAQGIALYWLLDALDAKHWPATNRFLFAGLELIAFFVPPFFIQGIGNMRARTLLPWIGVATLLCFALGWYTVWRQGPDTDVAPGIFGFFAFGGVYFFLQPGLFIAQALLTGGDQDRRFMASYPTHFDVAWKMALQFLLAGIFTGIFWLVLWLGAELFTLIDIHYFVDLLEKRWFFIPATTLASAAALHITDVRPGLVRGMRGVLLTLFSWLLPLMTLIATGFLLSVLLKAQFRLHTTHASGDLLVAIAVLVILINALYQDGSVELKGILRLSGRVAAFALLPLIVLAIYSLHLRIAQYGLTASRVATAACALVALCYALGYAAAALRPGAGFLKLMERWNFITALLILAVLLAVFSPLADPERIAVNSQVAALESGRTDPAHFDFAYLRDSGRYGADALRALKASPNRAIARAASAPVAPRFMFLTQPMAPQSSHDLVAHITVHPAGKSLPASFLSQKWSAFGYNSPDLRPRCLNPLARNLVCDAVLADLDGDGKEEVILVSYFHSANTPITDGPSFVLAQIYKQNGTWAHTANLRLSCKGDREALLAGHFKMVPPAPGPADIQIGTHRISVIPLQETDEKC